MAKFDEAQIDRGRRLRRFLVHPDAAPFLAEWDERIETAEGRVANWRPEIQSAEVLACAMTQLSTLKSLRQWIVDEIDAGGKELERKQQAEETTVHG